MAVVALGFRVHINQLHPAALVVVVGSGGAPFIAGPECNSPDIYAPRPPRASDISISVGVGVARGCGGSLASRARARARVHKRRNSY